MNTVVVNLPVLQQIFCIELAGFAEVDVNASKSFHDLLFCFCTVKNIDQEISGFMKGKCNMKDFNFRNGMRTKS